MDNRDNALWLIIVIGLAFLSYLPHLLFAIDRWWDDRKRHDPRQYQSFRGMFVATMLQLGFLRALIVVISFLGLPPWVEFMTTALAVILIVLLLSGGLVLSATWVVERRRRA